MKFLPSDTAVIGWANKKGSHVFKPIQLFSMELDSLVQVKRWKNFTVDRISPIYNLPFTNTKQNEEYGLLDCNGL
jgi:hypothetical protein